MASEKGANTHSVWFFLVLLTSQLMLAPVEGRKLGEVSGLTSTSTQDIRKPDCINTPYTPSTPSSPLTPFTPLSPFTPSTPFTPSSPLTPTPFTPLTPSIPSHDPHTPPSSTPLTPSTPSTPSQDYRPPSNTPLTPSTPSTPSHDYTPPSNTPHHGSTPSHGSSSSHGSTPSHGGSTPSTPSHGGGGYYNTPTVPVTTPPSTPSNPTPLVPYTPTPTFTPTPLVPLTPPVFPVLPTPPTTPVPFDPNTMFPGTCFFWSTHPMLVWGILGYWGTMGGAFSPLATSTIGQDLSLPEALSNTRTDGIGALFREGAASLLNSMVDNKFPLTTQQVRDAFLSSLHSDRAAEAQAKVFKKVNEAHLIKIKH